MMLALINMMLHVEHRQHFVKIKAGLMKQILMAGFSGISDTVWVEDPQMLKDKLIDGKELKADLKANFLR